MNRDEKSAAVAEIAEQIEASEAIFAIDYRGISVPQAAELRSKLRESDASFRVVKNRLTKLAADQAKREELKELLEGPTALTFVRGDTASAAKTITTFNREHEVLTFKGGFMEDMALDVDRFTAIAKLPSRDVLIGQFAGVVASPITGLVRGLGSMIGGLALQLGQIAEQGLVTGEAPAAEPDPEPAAEDEAPAEDAPAEEAPAEQAEEDAPAEEQPEAEAPSDEPTETAEPEADAAEEEPGTPGSEAEDVPADGEAGSPSEEASTSDASPTNSGDEAASDADAPAEPDEPSTTENNEEE